MTDFEIALSSVMKMRGAKKRHAARTVTGAMPPPVAADG